MNTTARTPLATETVRAAAAPPRFSRKRWGSGAFLVSAALVMMLGLPAAASDKEPSGEKTPEEAITLAVMKRLEKRFQRRAMFSRARRLPPKRTLTVAKRARPGQDRVAFLTFSIAQAGQKAAEFSGCYYPSTGEVYLAALDPAAPAPYLLAASHPALQVMALPFVDPVPAQADKLVPSSGKPVKEARAGACIAGPSRS